MTTKTAFLISLLAAIFFTACSDDDAVSASGTKKQVLTLNVDVVIPENLHKSWQNSIDWALANLEKAQMSRQRQVKLNLRFHDEDTEDLEALAIRLTRPAEGDDTCHAIIGPYHSSNARTFLDYAAATRLPVVMPSCTSGELQRVEARSNNTWFLTESDITQCEVLLSLSRMDKPDQVALIYSNDAYGETFYNWFAYYATEYRVQLADDPLQAYKKGDDLSAYLQSLRAQAHTTQLYLALSRPEDYLDVLKQIGPAFDDATDTMVTPICTDVGLSAELIKSGFDLYGIHPVASPTTGFTAMYESKFGRIPYSGEAHLYDALCLVALGAAKRMGAKNPNELSINGVPVSYDYKPYGPTLTDWMRAAVADEKGPSSSWTAQGLATAFESFSLGGHCILAGALGNWLFDETTHTSMLQTYYALWKKLGKQTQVLNYFTAGFGAGGTSSTTLTWEWDKLYEQQFNPDLVVDHNLPATTDRWAVVISPSTSWANYRHQADAFAMYQLLRHHGYDDDHIVLICEDNLADSEKNAAHKGEIYVMTGADNVRKNAKVDYRFSDLTRDDLCDILLGKQSDRLPHVVHSTASSNVFLFWSGHGGEGEGPLWGDESAQYAFGTDRLLKVVEQMHAENRYRRMMLAIETCFSGLWGEAIQGIPDVLAITAANGYEPSKADVHDRELGVFLSNAFSRSFRDAINGDPYITVHNLFTKLARTTTGSHVSLYNETNYGSVYDMDMSDFIGE